MKKLRVRILAIIVMVTAIVVGSASPAVAYQGGPPGLYCSGSPWAPYVSGGRLYWEGQVSCTGWADIMLRINVYRVVGNGDNQSWQWIDYSQREVITSSLYTSASRSCINSNPTRYQVNHYAYVNGWTLNPSPHWSSGVTLYCGV